MRFKKGDKVEVFSQTTKPAGSWRCAEILCDNGHNYTLRYCSGSIDESVEKRVTRKLLRPCPPQLEFLENWNPGNIIEVLHNFSWKMAAVSKVLSRGYFLVRLVGFSDEFEVRKSDIRVRQSWVNGEWVVIGKSFLTSYNRSQQASVKHNQKSRSRITRSKSKINLQMMHAHVVDERNINFSASYNTSPRMLKRALPNCFSQAEECRKKSRAIEKDSKCHPVLVQNLPYISEKVTGKSFPREILGEKDLPSFAYDRTRNLSGTDEPRMERNGVFRCASSVSSGPYDDDNDKCSTSCSSVCSNSPFSWPLTTIVHPVEFAEDYCSDAESICWSYDEEKDTLSTKEELATGIHRLELHAYRCTMEALHASGPLSWEQESLMTNLRISLHISNDEHLMELRNLISNSGSPHIS